MVSRSNLGGPAISTARPAIFPCLIISSTTAAALRAFSWPTRPWEATLGSSVSASTPNPRMCECAAIRLRPRRSLLSPTVTTCYVMGAKRSAFCSVKVLVVLGGSWRSLQQPYRPLIYKELFKLEWTDCFYRVPQERSLGFGYRGRRWIVRKWMQGCLVVMMMECCWKEKDEEGSKLQCASRCWMELCSGSSPIADRPGIQWFVTLRYRANTTLDTPTYTPLWLRTQTSNRKGGTGPTRTWAERDVTGTALVTHKIRMLTHSGRPNGLRKGSRTRPFPFIDLYEDNSKHLTVETGRLG